MPRVIPALRLAAFYFAYLAALGAFSPYVPLWLHERGLSAAAISGVMSLWYGTRIVSPMVWGHLALHSARPVRWLRIGALAVVACFAFFLLPLPLAGIVAAMAGYSFFYNALMPQFDAITLSHLHQRPQDYSRIRAWAKSPACLAGASCSAIAFRRGFEAGSGSSTHMRRDRTRSMLPSTGAALRPKAIEEMAAAVYGPMPGSFSRLANWLTLATGQPGMIQRSARQKSSTA